MISGPAKGGHRAISARPTQREQRTMPTTFHHNGDVQSSSVTEFWVALLPGCATTTDTVWIKKGRFL